MNYEKKFFLYLSLQSRLEYIKKKYEDINFFCSRLNVITRLFVVVYYKVNEGRRAILLYLALFFFFFFFFALHSVCIPPSYFNKIVSKDNFKYYLHVLWLSCVWILGTFSCLTSTTSFWRYLKKQKYLHNLWVLL